MPAFTTLTEEEKIKVELRRGRKKKTKPPSSSPAGEEGDDGEGGVVGVREDVLEEEVGLAAVLQGEEGGANVSDVPPRFYKNTVNHLKTPSPSYVKKPSHVSFFASIHNANVLVCQRPLHTLGVPFLLAVVSCSEFGSVRCRLIRSWIAGGGGWWPGGYLTPR